MHRRTLPHRLAREAGFTLIEVMVTTLILLVVSGVVINGIFDMTAVNNTATNRSAMFAGVRNATALLQQEVGQAGRISLPSPVLVDAAAAAGANQLVLTSTTGMFVGEYLVVGSGDTEETVEISAIAGNTITLDDTLTYAHAADEPIRVEGAFHAGVLPAIDKDGNAVADGSSGSVLKIFGDINGSGKMVYVEYTCDLVNEVLYRNQMDFDEDDKTAPGVEQILVENVKANPDGVDADAAPDPCFTYQTEIVGDIVFVIGVAITLTVESEDKDPVTGEYHQESKALLNVSPRNVFNSWKLYNLELYNRVHNTPPSVLALAPEIP